MNGAISRGLPIASFSALGLPFITLVFLFSGFYKGLFWSPVDLTALTGVLTLLATIPNIKLTDLRRQPAVWLLVILIGYLALRTLPLPNPWGLRKLAETCSFGVIALLAGFVIASRIDISKSLFDLLSYSSIPMAAILTIASASGDPFEFQGLGSAGYQITAAFFSLSLFASCVSRRWLCIGFALYALCLTGNISAAIFAPIAVVIALMRSTKITDLLKGAALAFVLVTTYSIVVSPPLLIMRAIWKIGGLEAKLNTGQAAIAPGASYKGKAGGPIGHQSSPAAPLTESLLESLPSSMRTGQEIQTAAADRIDIYKAAWQAFKAAPIFGNGYGRLAYTVHPYPHNILLEMLAEGGILAGILLVATIVLSLPSPNNDISGFALAAIIVFVATAMFSGYFGGRILMFAIGLGIGAGPVIPRLYANFRHSKTPKV